MFDSLLGTSFWGQASKKLVEWTLTSAPTILLILILGFAALKLLTLLLGRLEKAMLEKATRKSDEPNEIGKRVATLMGILRNAVRVIIFFMLFILILKELGVDVAPIIAGAGVLGLAVGFGAQNLVRDIISGFFLLLENQIRVGDVAVVNGQGGLVEGINLRTTTLRDLTGTVHIFPNGAIDRLSNMTKNWSAMVFDIGVAYKEDTDRVIQVMKDVFHDLKSDEVFKSKILEDIEVFGLDRFDDSAIIIKARIKTIPIEQWNVGREFNKRLKVAFDSKGIEIPFPHRTIYWGESSEAFQVLMKNKGK